MIILCKTPDYLKDEPNDLVLNKTLSMLYDEYCEYTDDSEAYLVTDYVSLDDVIFGKDQPEQLKKIAKHWNDDIYSELIAALKSFITSSGGTLDALTPIAINSDSWELYRLKKAVIAANNDWHDFADKMTYICTQNGNAFFNPLLTEENLNDILMHPEEYIVVEVPVK